MLFASKEQNHIMCIAYIPNWRNIQILSYKITKFFLEFKYIKNQEVQYLSISCLSEHLKECNSGSSFSKAKKN